MPTSDTSVAGVVRWPTSSWRGSGFGPGGATTADIALMRKVVGAEMGVKAAGGVKDYEALKQMVAAGATRVGASAGVRIVQESRGGRPAAAMPSGY